MSRPPVPTIVVIGYGNPLRSDDGVGPRVAEDVAGWRLPGVLVLAAHQLIPEMAEPLAAARLAIFIDARPARVDEATRVRPLEPGATGMRIGHVGNPRSVLELARAAFGQCPRAWSITVPATNLALGEELSPTARRGMADALWQIASLVKRETENASSRACETECEPAEWLSTTRVSPEGR